MVYTSDIEDDIDMGQTITQFKTTFQEKQRLRNPHCQAIIDLVTTFHKLYDEHTNANPLVLKTLRRDVFKPIADRRTHTHISLEPTEGNFSDQQEGELINILRCFGNEIDLKM
jgi:hypothetical protein